MKDNNDLSKMIFGATPCFPNNVSQGSHIYATTLSDHVVSSSSSSLEPNSSSQTTYSNSLLYSLSILKEKVHQVQSLVMTTLVCPGQLAQPPDSTAIAIANMGSLIQEIMVTASSLMFTFQQLGMTMSTTTTTTTPSTHNHHSAKISTGGGETGQGFYPGETLEDWYGNDYDNITNCDTNNININIKESSQRRKENNQGSPKSSYDIIELDAADLLAKYTHYCQVCGKGFKRDANLRMHMRAHGDEYKSSAALSNPMKKNNNSTTNSGSAIGDAEGTTVELPRKYSCPQEGCRWNRKHAKFQPLKSMICVKNHYKRSHCPKMYVCKRCNRKQFSVLSDLRTHEKHCGDLKWQCSCGTTFSRKDKLMGHVALFVGHAPKINCSAKMGKVEQHDHQIQMRVENR